MKKYINRFYFGCLILVLSISCQKNAPLIQQPPVAEFFMTLVSTVADASFSVQINGELVFDSLDAGHPGRKIVALDQDSTAHIQLRDRGTGKLVTDTAVSVSNNMVNLVVLYLAEGDSPVLLMKPDVEVPDGFTQNAFLFTDPYMPASFDLNVYAAYEDLTYDTVLQYKGVRKGVLTDFRLLDMRPNANGALFAIAFLEPLDPATGLPLPLGNAFQFPIDGPQLFFFASAQEKWFINTWKADLFAGQVYLYPYTKAQY